ncbi:LLM class flavin-dependent oxidoreductase [Pontibacter diazotrophicus]|uniref:LLM class flavin-dependent oxidoreductase n=1 Tax=Pontibacter diazotrophicus TaxID=1400979 RepID=A0A3D8LD96_9BACT|nr:LLM class flavin-dependent oxidoreductase [Pontibacter diazotrophicus]RDV15370.1 LLM class flavin-dependent oxidoreductase [Pontibacter diazotrophicus]
MKFGIFIDLQLPRPWQEGDEYKLFQEALEQVALADRLGIDYVWVQEHHFLEEYCHSSAPEVFLAACSQRTKNIRLGHGIVAMSPRFNHPARVAERLATLDLLSGGRVEWGTGESGSRMELEGFGVDFVDKRAMWAEALQETAKMMRLTPYPGFQGKYFSMPHRNVVPKPLQKPHPPIWAACSNRDSLHLAAQLGLGALTFAFVNAEEAKFWVDEYYETFKKECRPLGQAVNPNVAMLTGFMCHPDHEIAISRGQDGAQFFAYGLGHYWRDGIHFPGHTDLWSEFQKRPVSADQKLERERKKAGMRGIGNPKHLIENFRSFETAGVDQLILLQQCGSYQHEHICESLELFAAEVLPQFKEREAKREKVKQQELEPFISEAQRHIQVPELMKEVPPVEAYPLIWEKLSSGSPQGTPDRRPGMTAFWQMQVSGKRPKN